MNILCQQVSSSRPSSLSCHCIQHTAFLALQDSHRESYTVILWTEITGHLFIPTRGITTATQRYNPSTKLSHDPSQKEISLRKFSRLGHFFSLSRNGPSGNEMILTIAQPSLATVIIYVSTVGTPRAKKSCMSMGVREPSVGSHHSPWKKMNSPRTNR